MLLARGLCVGLITRPEESYMSVLCPTYREGETSIMWTPWPSRGCCGLGNKNVFQLQMLLQIVPRRSTSYNSFSVGAGRSSETLEGVRRTRVLENSTLLTMLWKGAAGYVENSERSLGCLALNVLHTHTHTHTRTRNLSFTANTVFVRVICALFFLFWPLKNRGA